MSRYRLTARAEADLREITNYIAQDDPRAAVKVNDAIHLGCTVLARFHDVGRIRKARPRLLGYALPQYPCTIIYRTLREGGIEVVHIYRGERDIDALLK